MLGSQAIMVDGPKWLTENRLVRPPWLAGLAGLLFAVHPLTVEPVACRAPGPAQRESPHELRALPRAPGRSQCRVFYLKEGRLAG